MALPDGRLAIYRATSTPALWCFDNNANYVWDGGDACYGGFGAPNEQPVVTREGMIGTYWATLGKWYFDTSGDRLWSGCGVDLCLSNWRPNEKVWRGAR